MIIVLGIGNQIDMYELNNMASWPYDRNALVVSSYRDLPTVESRLSIAICDGEFATFNDEEMLVTLNSVAYLFRPSYMHVSACLRHGYVQIYQRCAWVGSIHGLVGLGQEIWTHVNFLKMSV